MAAVQRGLVAGIGMDCRHDAALYADGVVQDFGKRGEAIGGAGSVRDHAFAGQHVAVVHAIDYGAVNIGGRGRDQDLAGAAFQVDVGFQTVIEGARAFQDHIATLPIQLLRVIGRECLDRATAQVQRVTVDAHLVAKTAVNGVITQQVGVGFKRAGGVDLHHLNVVSRRLVDMRQCAAPDASEAVDTDGDHDAAP